MSDLPACMFVRHMQLVPCQPEDCVRSPETVGADGCEVHCRC